MKFICDVHISYKLVKFLNDKNFEAIHVNMLPDKWYTKDNEICAIADANDLIVITKDEDFRSSFFLKNSPNKLIRVVLGNISNQDLLALFEKYVPLIETLNDEGRFYLELGFVVNVYP
jgi:predicted nuclease of predicted toxin-antitoxin system